MRDRLVGTRYAEALVKIAKDRNELDRVTKDLDLIAETLFKNRDLMRFIEGPQFSEEDKKGLLRKVFQKKVSDTALDFLLLLIDKYRISWVFFVIEQFKVMKRKEEGIADAHIVSRSQLSDDVKGELARVLSRLTNKKIRLSLKVEPDIIGGLVVSIENKLIDASIRGRLCEVRENLLAARVH